MWYKAEGLSDDSDNKPLRLPIATFYIKRIGWRLDDGPSDLFCLVNRINPDISDPDYSSSRFKGTGGTKFMLTYTSNRLGKPTIQQKPSATGIYYSVYNRLLAKMKTSPKKDTGEEIETKNC